MPGSSARTSCWSRSRTSTSRSTWGSACAGSWSREARELWERDDPAKWSWVRVATKYPNLTRRYFAERGIQVEVVRLDGSIELAPLVGLAERIVDLVQSGETLRANGLVEVAEILQSTARLIVNRAAQKTAHRAVGRLLDELRAGVGA